MEEIKDSPVYKDIEAQIRAAANSIFPSPVHRFDQYVEHERANLQYQFDMMYEAGMIPSRPTVSVKSFNPQTGDAEFTIDFPVTTVEALLQYAEDDPENSAIDSPLDKP